MMLRASGIESLAASMQCLRKLAEDPEVFQSIRFSAADSLGRLAIATLKQSGMAAQSTKSGTGPKKDLFDGNQESTGLGPWQLSLVK